MSLHSIGMIASILATSAVFAADWPQFLGPDRTNVSRETGLASVWPKDGPPLVWKQTGFKDGVVPVSIAGGRVFTTGNDPPFVICTALAEADGKFLWSAKIGPAAREMGIMRYLSQMSPMADGERLYIVTTHGDYVCLQAKDGKELWRKHFADFEGKKHAIWGYCDYPLIEDDRLIIAPGGDKNTVAAIDKKTGALIWGCPIPGETAAHSMMISAVLGGVKQYVIQMTRSMYGVSTEGKLLWSYSKLTTRTANTHAPIARDDQIFFANGYGAGQGLLSIKRSGDKWEVEGVRVVASRFRPWLGFPTRIGDSVIVNTSTGIESLEWKSGAVKWFERVGNATYTIADGKLLIRTQAGEMILASFDAAGFGRLASFKPPRSAIQSKDFLDRPAFTFPVVANGRLYIRDFDEVYCFDIRDPKSVAKKPSDAVSVPTPNDVVVRMLELAGVKESDFVYDLGSGDGRIIIAAAKRFGAKAVGVEIEDELVAMSRTNAKEAGVENRVEFMTGDLFKTDFSRATVVTLYILPDMLERLAPKLSALKPGTRIVSHYFAIPGVAPDNTVRVKSEEDGLERNLYLYTVPLKAAKDK